MLQFAPPKFAQIAESAEVLFTPLRLKLNNVRRTETERKRKLKQYDVRGSY